MIGAAQWTQPPVRQGAYMAKELPILQERLKELSHVRLHSRRWPLMVFLGVLSLATTAVAFSTAREFTRERAAWNDLRRAQSAAAQIETVLSLAQGAETGQRGYV